MTAPQTGRQYEKDLADISQLVARFDDAVWEVCEPMPMHVEGRTAVIETWQRMLGATVWLFRGSFTGVVTVDGDRATGRWPCVETGVFAATPTQPERHYDNRSLYEDFMCGPKDAG